MLHQYEGHIAAQSAMLVDVPFQVYESSQMAGCISDGWLQCSLASFPGSSSCRKQGVFQHGEEPGYEARVSPLYIVLVSDHEEEGPWGSGTETIVHSTPRMSFLIKVKLSPSVLKWERLLTISTCINSCNYIQTPYNTATLPPPILPPVCTLTAWMISASLQPAL